MSETTQATNSSSEQEVTKPKLKLRSSSPVALGNPLRYKGLFDKYGKFDISPFIGVEFRNGAINLRDLLYAENSDELFLDLAVLIAERGVVLFRNQDLTYDEHTLIVKKLSTLPIGKKVEDAKLHVHPMTHTNPEHGDHILKIYSKLNTVYKGNKRERSQRTTGLFHTDLFYEKRPADISALRMTKVPENGAGGTVFGSGYHAYSRITPIFAKFLEQLTVHADWNSNLKLFDKVTGDHYREGRGAENQGANVVADHPLVRTNPITGWKSIYYSVIHGKYINELDFDESLTVTEFLERLLTENHEYLIKIRWETNDLAIWDNRSTFHSATMDYEGLDVEREGYRVTTLGELPYLDENSISIKEYEQLVKDAGTSKIEP